MSSNTVRNARKINVNPANYLSICKIRNIMSDNVIAFKVYFYWDWLYPEELEVRRFEFVSEDVESFENWRRRIFQEFEINIEKLSRYAITYMDTEEDQVLLLNQEDWRIALQEMSDMPVCKITITAQNKSSDGSYWWWW